MNHINVSVTVGRTPAETMNRLQEFFREYAPEAEMTFALRAPFDISSLSVGVTLQRDVTARFAPLGNTNRAYAISWEPVAAGPFPAFSGTIFINSSEADETETCMTLDGHYHPPLGVAGDVFDALVGKHIAQASAADLLERISMYVDEVLVRAPAFA
jgi:hypothetical protein